MQEFHKLILCVSLPLCASASKLETSQVVSQ